MPCLTLTRPEWVLAAPFRAHVCHLIESARTPWPAIAYAAGVPLGMLHTLLFGRDGKVRPKITQDVGARLLDLHLEDLAWMRSTLISAEHAGERIRLLRSFRVPWDQIASFLDLDQASCQAIARNERTCCTVMVDTLAQAGCEWYGVLSDDPREDEATPPIRRPRPRR